MNIRIRHPRFPTFPEDFIDSFFFQQSKEAKPPYDVFPIVDPEDEDTKAVKGWEIQVALAGFKAENVKVWHEGQSLHIKGDNTENNVSGKFTCQFEHKFAARDNLDLDSAEVGFTDGILSVKVPIKEPESGRKYLYGK